MNLTFKEYCLLADTVKMMEQDTSTLTESQITSLNEGIVDNIIKMLLAGPKALVRFFSGASKADRVKLTQKTIDAIQRMEDEAQKRKAAEALLALRKKMGHDMDEVFQTVNISGYEGSGRVSAAALLRHGEREWVDQLVNAKSQ